MAAQADSTPPRPGIHKWGRPADATEGYLVIGRILGAWRGAGHILVESLTDFPDRFAPGRNVWIRGARHTIEDSEQRGSKFRLKLAGVDSPDEAEQLKGLFLEVPESELRELEPDTYYEFQIVGLRVITEDGQQLGTITEVLHTGSNDVYVADGDAGRTLIPAIDDVIKKIDLNSGEMIVELLEGLTTERQRRK